MTERGLVEAALQGNAMAFSTLVEAYQRVMVASARRVTRNDADAEDLAQDALVDAYRNLPLLRDHNKFRPWLFGILRHKCLDYLQAYRPEELAFDELDEIAAPIPAELPDIAELLDQLPFPYREVLVMRHLQGLDFREIAGILGTSEQAVIKRCSRARAQLRALATARNDRHLQQIMAGLLAFPLSDTFTHRVAKEVLTMAQVTAKGKAAASGTAAGLAWLLGWKGVATICVMLALGAGVAVPIVIQHRQQAAKQAVTIHFISVKPTPAAQQEADILRVYFQAIYQPKPDWDTVFSLWDHGLKTDNGMNFQQVVAHYKHDPAPTKQSQQIYAKYGSLQELQVIGTRPTTNNGITYERLNVKCIFAHGTADCYFDFNEKHELVNNCQNFH